MKIEDKIKLLEKYAREVEDDSTTIEDSLKTFEDAIEITKHCIEIITSHKGRFEELSKELNNLLIENDEE